MKQIVTGEGVHTRHHEWVYVPCVSFSWCVRACVKASVCVRAGMRVCVCVFEIQ